VLGGTVSETATTGIDELGKRCEKYYAAGCRFAKWRAVLKIGPGLPSNMAVAENAFNLARYASICQDNGLMPIVEPEVLIDGPHTIEECAAKSEVVFAAVTKALQDQGVLLEGMLLKPNMITPGSESTQKAPPQQIAWFTVRTLSRTLPAAVPGVVFLSGGQSEESATVHLNAVNQVTGLPRPWGLSFSFGRALQDSCLKAWLGKPENVKAAQDVFFARCKANSEATLGKYAGGTGSTESLHVKSYVY
jgi:fructose-bisphosphate aldolase class I